jgi:hypothetical protein
MKTRSLALKLAPLTVATAKGPVFRMLDAPGVVDAHGDTMDAGALELPPPGDSGCSEVPLYFLHSYSEDVVLVATPSERVAIGVAVVWMEEGEPFFTPRFFGNTDLSTDTQRRTEAGELTRCSVGYLTLEATSNDSSGEDVHRARLIEVSLVDRGAKESAVRVKNMSNEALVKLETGLAAMRAELKQLRAKSSGVEMMCYGPLYFASEYLEHLGEAVAAAQTFLQSGEIEPTLVAIATQSIATIGEQMAKLSAWMASPAARGEAAPAEAPPAEQAAPPAEAVATKAWWAQFSKLPAAK